MSESLSGYINIQDCGRPRAHETLVEHSCRRFQGAVYFRLLLVSAFSGTPAKKFVVKRAGSSRSFFPSLSVKLALTR